MGKYLVNFLNIQMLKGSTTNNVSPVILLVITWLANSVTGCAINNTGLIEVKHFENETIHMVKLKTFGGFLSTNEADAGLTFGFTERQYFYPKNKLSMKDGLSNMLLLANKDRLVEQENGQTNIDYSDKAIAWISNTNGLIFNTNSHKVGLSLGVSKSQMIKLHRNFNGVFIFKYISGNETKAYYNQNKPLK
ncbi:MAG: hypothetical protein KAJ63_01855 [Methyloprofundus sp.]|nr:hypothetical protein [Methyloprofundus sp.]